MKQLSEILKKYDIKPYRYTKSGKATIVEDKIRRFSGNENRVNKEIFSYFNLKF